MEDILRYYIYYFKINELLFNLICVFIYVYWFVVDDKGGLKVYFIFVVIFE